MRGFGKRVNETAVPFLPLFVVSAVVVMFFLFFQKSELLIQTEIFEEGRLSLLKYHAGGDRSLFLYVLKERIWVIPLLFLFSTTYLSAVVCYGVVIWYGAGIGALLAVAMMRYGVIGIILVLTAGLPQYLLYLPIMVITLQLIHERRVANRKFFLQLLILEVVVIIGCILESYVNLMLVEKIIKIFIL